ncbi:MAG: glycosyltransferase [Lachnospiraceae bacterium]|nr:glycosyltransferase [Lachnospiraceae bacterium]
MKLLSVAIPCYNSAEYMERAIKSILVGGHEVEIIIVDDGSSDNTLEIAKSYEAKFPGIVKAVHQENGGHGSAVNTGLKEATGLYYKVVDSDDWLDEDAFKQVLEKLRSLVEDAAGVDMFVCNYVYERVSEGKQKVMDYRSAMPRDVVFGWSEMQHFKASQYILMHSVIYSTKMLRQCKLELPKHTFYVDNIFVYHPLPYVKKIYYMDVDLYRYYIGRADQSVNEKVMIGRVDQQLRVTKLMINDCDLSKIRNKKLRKYMAKYLAMMMTICTVFLLREGSEDSLKKREDIWNYLKDSNKYLYRDVKRCILGKSMQLNGKVGNRIIILGYKLSQRIYGFS